MPKSAPRCGSCARAARASGSSRTRRPSWRASPCRIWVRNAMWKYWNAVQARSSASRRRSATVHESSVPAKSCSPWRDRLDRYGGTDLCDVHVTGPAAPSHDVEARQPCLQLAVMTGERVWIAGVQLLGRIELGVALLGGVGAQAANPTAPVTLLLEHIGKVRRVSAVDHEVGDRIVGLSIDRLDRFSERLPTW